MNKFTLCVAAALSLLPAAVFAQDATTAAPMIPAPSPNIFETTPAPAAEKLDYSLEFNNVFGYTDIVDAKADHLSDRQIAEIYKIAKLTGNSFSTIFCQVQDGMTFLTISDEYNFPYNELWNVRKEEDEINAYMEAHAATGLGNARRPYRVMSSIDSIKK